MSDSTTATTADDVRATGHAFVAALTGKDADAMLALFAPEVDFRALTPGQLWERGTSAEVVREVILGTWFSPGEAVELVEAVDTGLVGDRGRVSYRLRVAAGDSRYVVEQQAYLELTGGEIAWMRLLCSGFRPVPPGG
jgi:ketosteroid isomerase-like protein